MNIQLDSRSCLEIRKANYEKGFEITGIRTPLNLIGAELYEYYEAIRKGKEHTSIDTLYYLENYVSYPKSLVDLFDRKLKGSPIEELADTIIRVMDLCGSDIVAPNLIDQINVILSDNKEGVDIFPEGFSRSFGYIINLITTPSEQLCNILAETLMWCYNEDDIEAIDLAVKIKLAYNKARPHKHGKQF